MCPWATPALDIVDTLVKSAAVDMVVVDSVAALVPKAELEGEMGDHHIALQVLSVQSSNRELPCCCIEATQAMETAVEPGMVVANCSYDGGR